MQKKKAEKERLLPQHIVNEEQNTVEVKFSDKPAKEITDSYTADLAQRKIRHGAEQTPERIELAKELAKED